MKTISFVIPFYNEEKRLGKTFEALRKLKLPASLVLENLIFVNDGSTDKSELLIKKEKKSLKDALKSEVSVISYSENKGKGYAVKQGILSSTSDYCLFFDVDISTPLSEIWKFLLPMARDVDVIIGTRKTAKSEVLVHQPFLREFLGRGFTVFTRSFLGIKASDITCGFKAVSRMAGKIIGSQMTISGWGYDAELLYLAQKENLSLEEMPVVWSNDPNSRVNLYKAVLTTLKELFIIKWEYNFKPALTAYPNRMSLAFSKFASIFV